MYDLGFQIFWTLNIMITVFQNVKPFSHVDRHQCLGGNYFIKAEEHLRKRKQVPLKY